MARERILLVEDEPDIAEVLQYNLEKEGFEVEVARRGDSGLDAIRRQLPDLVLLDLMLPGLDGLELTRMLKRDAATARLPIVMLTARGEEVDRIVGLELGADDYISKPFSPREVVLRVKAVLRRLQAEESTSDRLEVGGIHLDVSGHQLRVRGKEAPLTATEFACCACSWSAADGCRRAASSSPTSGATPRTSTAGRWTPTSGAFAASSGPRPTASRR